MEIKNIEELIEELFIRKSITVKTIRNIFKMSDARAMALFKMINENGYLLSINEEEKVLKKGKHREIIDFIKNAIDVLKEESAQAYYDENGDIKVSSLDPLFQTALKIVIQKQIVNTTMIQREICVGYERAVKIVEAMEDLDLISNGLTRPRIVFAKKEDFEELFGSWEEVA